MQMTTVGFKLILLVLRPDSLICTEAEFFKIIQKHCHFYKLGVYDCPPMLFLIIRVEWGKALFFMRLDHHVLG